MPVRQGRAASARLAAAVATGTALVVTATALAGCSDDTSAPPPRKDRAASATTSSPGPKATEVARPESMAALGDSITRGFDACDALADCPSVSWATGTSAKVDSVAQQLLEKPKGNTWNFARTGAVVADLPAQTDEAIARKPDLVTVLIGANDACTKSSALMTPVDQFRDTFSGSLRRLHDKLPESRVYVSSVPSLLRLWEVGHENPDTRRIWSLGICQSMLSAPQALDAAAQDRRARVQERVVAFNTVLKEECAKLNRCVYDDGAAFGYAFTPSHLSTWDFFHPSAAGQKALARMAAQRIEKAYDNASGT